MPPDWAVLQRQLFAALEDAADIYLAKYTRPDGSLIYADVWTDSRDGLDDLYEAFYNLPMLYLLGGDDRFLALAHHHWEAVTRQAADLGLVQNEYEIGYDQFHQGEGNLYFHFLCAADPDNSVLQDRAKRFANLYLGLPNYDPEHNIVRAVHTGAGGPRWGYLDDDHPIWIPFMECFGLPFDDVPDIKSFDDVAGWHNDPRRDANGARMRAVMNERMGQGDSVANLLATSIATNAYLMTGDNIYRDWVLRYTGGWWDRAARNGGLIPDNVGLNGEVGAYFGGAWHGAAYGWTWPHGYDSVIDAVTVSAMNATLLSGDTNWMALAGQQFDHIFAMGQPVVDYNDPPPPRVDPWIVHAAKAADDPAAFVVPKRYKATGWFDMQPVPVGPLATWWCTSFADVDAERLNSLQAAEPHDWSASYAFRAKGDDGHERPWLEYMAGRNAAYPETILQQSIEQVGSRLAKISADTADLTKVNIHHWQEHNPVTTEALIQLTLGGPQLRYNGGFLRCSFRYFDPVTCRPGLPPDIAALVGRIDADGADLTLVNLSSDQIRDVKVSGGFYGEHSITSVCVSGQDHAIDVNGPDFIVRLPPRTSLDLHVVLDRFSATPRYAFQQGCGE